MRTLMSKVEFDAIAKKCKYYAPNRFIYMNAICDILRQLEYDSILEVGAYRLRLDADSVVMDIKSFLPATVVHSADDVPFPFADKMFDVVVASQIIEHLQNKPQFFNEAERICNHLIISLPYRWKAGSESHRDIDENVIQAWSNRAPVLSVKIQCRIIQQYDFTEACI